MNIKIDKPVYYLANSFALLMTIFIAYFNYLTQGNSYTGIVFLLTISIILIPSNINLFRLNKKKIYNGWYNLILLFTSLYCSLISMYSILMYYAKYFIDSGESSVNYFFNHLPIMIILIIITFISSFFVEKIIIKTKEDHMSFYFFLIIVTSILPFFFKVNTFTLIMNILLIIFTIKAMMGMKGIFSNDSVRISYIWVFILSLLSGNVVAAILIALMFFDLDTIGVNV